MDWRFILFMVSGLLVVLSAKMLIWGLKNKKRNEMLIGSIVFVISIAYGVYYFFYL
jgi:hypothetical protein